MLSGLLVIDKPSGPTSFDVVREARRLLRAEKAGHTGTLDPLATGVLAVCIGEAVKLQQFLTVGDKAYEATIAFGAATDTEDAAGAVVERGDPRGLTAERVRGALPAFLGEVVQVPPMYSAIRVGGRRLHEAARAGETVERTGRQVRIDALEILAFDAAPAQDALARARVAVRCGKGTYVRTLAADLGRALGVPAHLAALRRTAAGPFTLAQAVTLEEARRLAAADALPARLVSPADALAFLPALRLGPEQAADVRHGRTVQLASPPPGLARALDAAGRLLAVCQPVPGGARPIRVMAPELTCEKD